MENAVLQVEGWVLAPLRRRRFFTLAEVSRALRPLLDKLNRSSSKHLFASRRDLLKRLDRPVHPWEFARWKQCRVDQYCHVSAGVGRYSVPLGLMKRRVWAALGARTVDVVHDGGRLASHVRMAEGEWSTRKDQMTPRYARRAEWTAERMRREAGTVGEGAAALLAAGAGTEQAAVSEVGRGSYCGRWRGHGAGPALLPPASAA